MKLVLLCSLVVMYSAVGLLRVFLAGRAGWLIGMIAFHLIGGFALRFLTNAKWFAPYAIVSAMSAEILVFRWMGSISVAIPAGTLLELLPAMYFARRFFLTMGE